MPLSRLLIIVFIVIAAAALTIALASVAGLPFGALALGALVAAGAVRFWSARQ
ncbi:hypothetical protein [Ostreiculturibacter nitratireducens]|uniref:hypothetical protein n=1 Tax=Ostreiculturibacter nitratireducens TaxID=3075226 RepID=UPI0031B608C1